MARHLLQIVIGDVVAMLDGVDAGFDRIVDAMQGHGVRCDFMVLAVRLIDDGVEFIRREGRDVVEHPIGPHEITAVGIDLDPVGAVADLLAHCLACVVGAVNDLHAMRDCHIRERNPGAGKHR